MTTHNGGRPKQHAHAIVVDGRYAYRAPVCGHAVSSPTAQRCRACYLAARSHRNRLVGREMNGVAQYRAPCGHVVRHPDNKECRPCRVARLRAAGTDYFHRGRQPEHRLIAERVLGRRLKRTEIVHHINMDKRDNRPRNLLICSREYHKELHHRMEHATARRIHAWYDSQEV